MFGALFMQMRIDQLLKRGSSVMFSVYMIMGGLSQWGCSFNSKKEIQGSHQLFKNFSANVFDSTSYGPFLHWYIMSFHLSH